MRCDYHDRGVCRSCTLLATPYAAQVAAKQAAVERVLADAAPGISWVAPAIGPESGFRNKAKLVAGGHRGAVTLGILGPDGLGVDLRRCGLHDESIVAALPRLAAIIDDIGLIPYAVPTRRGELKHVVVTASPSGDLMVRFILRSSHHEALLRSRLPRLLDALPEVRVVSINIQPRPAAILEGDREIVLTHEDSLRVPIGSVPLYLRPDGFFQTNTTVATALYAQARTWIDGAAPRTVWDLYCGVGGFALHAARPGRVVGGIEIAPGAIAAARRAADELGLAPEVAVFAAGDAATAAEVLPGPPDLVVVNPPRRGLDPDLVARLDASPASTLVYSSCHPATLARDLRALRTWRAEEGRLFDMFPQTDHLEVAIRCHRHVGRRRDGIGAST